ncbi:MAG: phage portal protein, partial [Acidimicrobiales bacterium]
LTSMEIDVSLAGNWYGTLADDSGRLGRSATGAGRRISRLRPDWVTIVIGSRSGDPRAADAKTLGYLYEPPPTGRGARSDPVMLRADEVVHYTQDVDPTARFRGMSWLTPVLNEISADRAATTHKLKFLERGATLGTVVSLDKDTSVEDYDEFFERFVAQHEGAENAYKTLFLGGGADVTVVGANLQQIDLKGIQGAGETRIASASGVGAIIAQFSEGMQGSALNAGNYGAARRRASDVLFRSLWQKAFASLEEFVTPPGRGVSLWYDEATIPFLQEDEADAADIQNKQAQTIRSLVDAGYDPQTVTRAVTDADWSLLRHTGLFSVQLQPPVPNQTALPAKPANGNGQVFEEV